jgi:hypothetical protein
VLVVLQLLLLLLAWCCLAKQGVHNLKDVVLLRLESVFKPAHEAAAACGWADWSHALSLVLPALLLWGFGAMI